MNQWLVSELFVRIGSLTVNVTWEIGLSLLWYEFVKATDHQYDKAISTRSCCIGSVWIVLFITFCFLFSFFFCFFDEFCKGYDCVQSVIWLNKLQITNGTELCHLAVCSFFCIKGFISLELWATISHAFALVKCEILFLVQTGVTSLPIARRDTLRAGGEKDFCRC